MKRITLTLPAPYVGLRPFDEKDALLFFGRDNHVRDLLAKLSNQQRFISVLGASGTGKSSLVRAGLIPALHRGALAAAGYHWHVHILKPGDAPLHNLVHALTDDPRRIDSEDRATSESSLRSLLTVSPLALTEQYRQRAERFGNEALLLVVDQFEEIFRYRQKNSDEAEAFIQLLLRTASEDVPIYVVMTMRSDFLGHCVAFFGLPEAINSGLYLTPRLGPDPLKSIIASPLALVGGDIDPVLTNRLVNTLGGDDELPILEHALLRMWNHAKAVGRNRIEAHDFETVCAPQHSEQADKATKVAFAIDNHASAIFEARTEKQQQLAKQMFLALVERRDGRDVRRPQTLQQLTDLLGKVAQPDLQAIIDAFRAEQVGFLLPPCKEVENIREETQIDISHQSLFRQWHLFQQWLKEEELDVSELKEWQQRALRQHQGGGWLDENDCSRAQRWRERINKRAGARQWAIRYGDAGIYEQVIGYIEISVQRLNQAKIEHERLEREKQEAVTKQLEAEARLQRESAERAEKEKSQAQAFVKASRRRSIIAIVFAILSIGMWLHADNQKNRAEKMARDAQAGELIATAENLVNSNPDQAVLLGLAARHISAIPKADALLRFAEANFNYQSLRGHERSVFSAQFSADGKTIVTASGDNTARVWDALTGKELHKLSGHKAEVWSAQFSSDSKMIVTASSDETARVWDAATGRELHKLSGHVISAQFSADGKTILTAGEIRARVWDTVTGKELHTLGHEASVSSAQFSADGQTIVTASLDKTARVWDAVTGKELQKLIGHKNVVRSAQFSTDGKTIVTASVDNTVRVWDALTGRELHTLGHESQVKSARFSADGKMIVTTIFDITARMRNTTAHVWDVLTGKELHKLSGHEAGVSSAQFSADGQTIVTASFDKTARVWDVLTGKELHKLSGHEAGVSSAQFSADGQTIVTASGDRTARVWNMVTGKKLHILSGHEDGVSSARFSADGKMIVTASWDKTARVWDVLTGKELHKLSGHKGGVFSAQFSADGKTIVTASWDDAHVWGAATGKQLRTLSGHKASFSSAQFSPKGKMIVTTSLDKTARVWGTASGKELHKLSGHEAEVWRAQFSADGKTIVTVSEDETVRVWDLMTGKELHKLRGHEAKVFSAQFSPDGKTIITTSKDSTVRVWDAATGKEMHKLSGREAEVWSAQFSPDGRTIVTASEDKTAKVWDAITGKLLDTLKEHKDVVRSAQFSADGKTIVTASADNTARIWRCEVCRPIEEIVAELQKRVGRGLTEEEHRRFGIPDSVSFTN